MKKIKLLLLILLVTTYGCKKDDEGTLNDAEEFFTATVVGNDGTVNFVATTDGITDYMTARTQGTGDNVRLDLRGTNFDVFLDLQFTIESYQGSSTYTSGDREDNPNLMRYGQDRSDRFWWVSDGFNHERVSTGTITINESAEFVQGTFSFQGYRQTNYKQVDGSFKVRKGN